MLSQTIDQIFPLLQLLEQPVICVHTDGQMRCNSAANVYAPSGHSLADWLGDGMQAYESWNRQEPLTIPVTLDNTSFTAQLQALADGVLLLLSQRSETKKNPMPMAATAQVLRQPLNDLASLTHHLSEKLEEMEDPFIQTQTAAINRQVYRLTRITCNLADLERLQNSTYQSRIEKMELISFLEQLSSELQDVCRSAGRQLLCKLPTKSMMLRTDSVLLKRAILHLLSNALKYSPQDTPIHFWVEANASSVLFRIHNCCRPEDQDLLVTAFCRLERRGELPDPQWGLGLGLPITRCIAQLMGGTVTVELNDQHQATVTLSISRKRPLMDTTVCTPPPFDYTGGMLQSLVELSDALPDSCFESLAL